MRQLRLLGTALIVLFALSVIVAGTASATEAGLLYLPKEGPPFKFEANSKEAGELTTAEKKVTVKCTGVSGTGESSEKEHVTLGIGTLTFKGCKQTKGKSTTSCSSEGAAAETIVVPIDWHLINTLKESTLEPGIAVLPLPQGGKPFKFTCAAGTAIVEVRGWDMGLVTVSSLTADVETAGADFVAAGENCDTSDTLCKKLQETEPFEANLSGKFEKAELTQPGTTLTWTPMMLVDD